MADEDIDAAVDAILNDEPARPRGRPRARYPIGSDPEGPVEVKAAIAEMTNGELMPNVLSADVQVNLDPVVPSTPQLSEKTRLEMEEGRKTLAEKYGKK